MKRFFISLLVLIFGSASADVNLLLTKGSDKSIPLAVVPFKGLNNNLAEVIAADLRFSGQFKVSDIHALPQQPDQINAINKSVWRAEGVEDLVLGNISGNNDNWNVHFSLVDLVKSANPQMILEQTYHINANQQRALAHHISDIIFQKLTGIKGIFSTRISYVQHANNPSAAYSLLIADADGFNPRSILTSPEPIMSPAWSPDGKKIAYVSFEGKRAQIYVANIITGNREIVSAAPGINGAPAWSPDGSKLALVLSKSGIPKVYLLNLLSNQLTQLTNGNSIDTEPNFAPDGQSIIFTSDRGGSPQIYRLFLSSGKIERITFSGDYNARASFSRDGKQIVMIHRVGGQYNIAIQNLKDGKVLILTNSGRTDSPTFAPNGMMVLYGNEYGELGLVSNDGRIKLRVPGKGVQVQDPAWSPFLN